MAPRTVGRGGGPDTLRVLVAIANHGTKNHAYLDALLASYRAMRHDVDIVVLSDRPKALGEDVEVRVGAPTDNPWSLPFGHRQLFADSADGYDLYIYSEDDTLITERHIDAFVELNSLLPDDEVPGFLRFEERPSGQRSYCSIHSSYRWLSESVRVHGKHVFASFSNEHSACFVLTRAQLRSAIDSGGFLVAPHEGAYDMLVSAATDPYVRCGLRRRICLTAIDDVLLHHLPNVYLGKLGIDEDEFRAQLDALMGIAAGEIEPRVLVTPTSHLPTIAWDVPQVPSPSAELRAMIPSGTEAVLTIGCSTGVLERDACGDGARITAIPLDQVAAGVARSRGIRTVSPDLSEAMAELSGERFDAVILHQILHHFPDPEAVLRMAGQVVSPSGVIVASVPNIRYHRLRQRLGRPGAPLPPGGRFEAVGVHRTDLSVLKGWLRHTGLQLDVMASARPGRLGRIPLPRLRWLDALLGDPLWVRASVRGRPR